MESSATTLARTGDQLDLVPQAEADLAAAERRGLRLAVLGRNAVLVPLAVWMLVAGNPPYNLAGVALIAIFIALGFGYLRLLASGCERRWHRFAFVAGDVAAVAAAALIMPVSFGDAVPQIFVFRGFGTTVLFIVIAAAALSLMPSLVLWSGIAACIGLWSVFFVITAGMEQTVSWSDMPPAPSRDAFYAVVLSPDFVGRGNRVTETLLLLSVAALLALAVGQARAVVRARAVADDERLRALSVFGQFVPADVALVLVRDRQRLAPSVREATVLFADVEGFTAFSESRPPAEVMAALSGLFDAVGRAVTSERGVVIGFAGDAVLAAFNTPTDCPDHPARALAAARLLAGRGGVADGPERLGLRIGVATGPVAAGPVGGTGRQAYTIYGDTVNVAQRLEAANKSRGTHLLIDRRTWEAAGRPAGYRDAGALKVRNRAEPVLALTLAA